MISAQEFELLVSEADPEVFFFEARQRGGCFLDDDRGLGQRGNLDAQFGSFALNDVGKAAVVGFFDLVEPQAKQPHR